MNTTDATNVLSPVIAARENELEALKLAASILDKTFQSQLADALTKDETIIALQSDTASKDETLTKYAQALTDAGIDPDKL